MNSIETFPVVLPWIVLRIVLYAIPPLLLKLLEMADRLHGIFE
jgi:hypothetical protein